MKHVVLQEMEAILAVLMKTESVVLEKLDAALQRSFALVDNV